MNLAQEELCPRFILYLNLLNAVIVQCYLFFRPTAPRPLLSYELPFVIFLVNLPCGLFPLIKKNKTPQTCATHTHTQDKCEMKISSADEDVTEEFIVKLLPAQGPNTDMSFLHGLRCPACTS